MQLILEHILLLSIHIYMGGHSLVMLYYILSEYDLQGAKSMTVLTWNGHSQILLQPSQNIFFVEILTFSMLKIQKT